MANGKYNHRNGETEPPTENGWYGFDGEHRNAIFAGKPVESGVHERALVLVDGDQYYRYVWNGDDDQTIADYIGRWWGPIVPPWRE